MKYLFGILVLSQLASAYDVQINIFDKSPYAKKKVQVLQNKKVQSGSGKLVSKSPSPTKAQTKPKALVLRKPIQNSKKAPSQMVKQRMSAPQKLAVAPSKIQNNQPVIPKQAPKVTKPSSSANQSTAKVEQKKKYEFSSDITTELAGNFIPGDGGLNATMDFDTAVKFLDIMSFGAEVSIARDFRDNTLISPSDTQLTLKASPIYEIKQIGTKLSARGDFYIPTSDHSREDSMRYAVRGGLGLTQPLGPYFDLKYVPSYRLNNHQYDTNAKDSSNIESVVSHRGILDIKFSEKWMLENEAAYKRAQDYEGYTYDKVVFAETLNFDIGSGWCTYAGISNENNLEEVEGVDTRVEIFNRDNSAWAVGLGFNF